MFTPLTETRRDCAAEEEESVVEGEDIDENPSSHCDCTTYVHIPPFTHYRAHREIVVAATIVLRSLRIRSKAPMTT